MAKPRKEAIAKAQTWTGHHRNSGRDTQIKARSCLGKRRFEFYVDAEKQAAIIRRKGSPCDTYACPYCGGYHLTSH